VSNEYKYEFPDRKVDISTEDMKVNTAELKSGKIKFELSGIDIPSGIGYEARVISPTITNEGFVVNLSKSKPTELVDCNGLHIVTDASQLSFDVTITLYPTGASPSSDLFFNLEISLIDVELKEAEVELLTDYSQSFITATAFSLFSDNTNLNVTLRPKLDLDVTNTFGSEIRLILSKIYLKGETGTTSILLNDDTPVIIPVNPHEPIDLCPYIKQYITLTSSYDSLIFDCTAIAPEGQFLIYDNSIIAAGTKLTVPFDITITEAVFNDTLAFNLPGLSSLSIIDTVEVRTAFSSSIPSDFGVQILLYNSEKQEVIGTLLTNPLTIKGSYTDGNVPVPSDIQYITVTNSSLESLQDADKLILQLSLNTDGKSKTFNQTNSLQARVGARIKTATNF
jgi:hypothetical protein